MKQNIPPIWVLNLKCDTDRMLFMKKQLNELGVHFEVVEGKDGNALTEEDLKVYSREKALRQYGKAINCGQIGCALSHISMWQRIIGEQHEEVLILEDDIKIDRALIDILENRHRLPQDYDLINFSTDAPQLPIGEFVFSIYKASRHQKDANRTSAYLITLKGAKKLLNVAFPICRPIDGVTGNTNLNNLASYGVFPRVVEMREIPSSIGDRDIYPNESDFAKQFRRLARKIAFRIGKPMFLKKLRRRIVSRSHKLFNRSIAQ